jgi:hypothetical protein
MTLEYAHWVLQVDANDPELKDRDEEFARLVYEARWVIRKAH